MILESCVNHSIGLCRNGLSWQIIEPHSKYDNLLEKGKATGLCTGPSQFSRQRRPGWYQDRPNLTIFSARRTLRHGWRVHLETVVHSWYCYDGAVPTVNTSKATQALAKAREEESDWWIHSSAPRGHGHRLCDDLYDSDSSSSNHVTSSPHAVGKAADNKVPYL